MYLKKQINLATKLLRPCKRGILNVSKSRSHIRFGNVVFLITSTWQDFPDDFEITSNVIMASP